MEADGLALPVRAASEGSLIMIWRLWLALAAALALLVIAAGCYVARAQPPEHADPALAPWFQGLHTEDGQGCCSQADCRPVEYRIPKAG